MIEKKINSGKDKPSQVTWKTLLKTCKMCRKLQSIGGEFVCMSGWFDPDAICYYCRERGHLTKDCPKYRKKAKFENFIP